MIRIAATKPVRLFFAGALALSMSSAAAITASANQAYAETDDGYTYCYAGLSWAEYWANEGVYNATNTTSVSSVDPHGDPGDEGGFDAVTRATWIHGPARGSFQSVEVLQMTDGTEINLAYFEIGTEGGTFYDTDGVKYTSSDDEATDTTIVTKYAADGTTAAATYTYKGHLTTGTKYVPVKVANSDLETFKADRKAKGFQVIENGGTLQGGTESEGKVKNYSVIADVDNETYGLKTVTKSGDAFIFSAANNEDTQTDSGIKDQELTKTSTIEESDNVSNSEGLYYYVASTKDGSAVKVGQWGEFMRVDIAGDYGDLASKMQSVTWTYYGKDSTGTNAVRTFGTKFAADNWMHSKQRIQLGLTKSVRCQFPEGYDGTGYWKLTVHALGYEDVTTSLFKVESDNIAKYVEASDEDKTALNEAIAKARSLKKSDYTTASWNYLQTELTESESLAQSTGTLFETVVTGQTEDLNAAIDGLVKAAQLPTAVSGLKYNGKAQTGVKGGSNVSITGNTATNAGSYKATVTPAEGTAWADGSTVAKTVSYTVAKANQSLTAKASTKTVKKAKVKKKAQKVSGAIKVTGAQGKVTYAKKSGSAKLKVASNGKITVKKKTKKGTYKVKVVVKAAGNGNYNAATKTVTVKVKVK